MSSSTEVYIGIYLVVDQFLEIDRTRRECEQGHQAQRRSSHEQPFCPECGSRIITVEYTEKRRMTSYDAAEEFGFMEDTFNNVDRGDKPCIWLGNETVDSLTKGEGYEGEFEINPQTIETAVTEFAEKYMIPLELLDDNDVDYAIHFGTVMYTR